MIPATDSFNPAPSFRVLVIEDSVTVRTFLRLWLRSEYPNVEVLEAEDGKSAFHILGRNVVNLIVSDLNMPGMDGLTFIDKLRANPVLKRKPVLILSGSLTPEIQQAAQRDPLLATACKPASPASLSSILKVLLAKAQNPLTAAAA